MECIKCHKDNIIVHLNGRKKKKFICNDCLIRNCPRCNSIIKYTTIYNYQHAVDNNSLCKICKGETAFLGKKHSKETRMRMSKNSNKAFSQTNEYREKQRKGSLGKKNPMYGKTLYEVWVKKYGKDEADIKLSQYKKNKSIETSGKNNPMYGKPTPKKSGNGISGYYKNWFFRSLLELSFMINIIERFNFSWISCEQPTHLKIPYKGIDEQDRNYTPDFILNKKYLVECKPRRLWNSIQVLIKKNAALSYCNTHSLKYKLIDVPKLNSVKLTQLIKAGKIQLSKSGIKKYEKFIKIKK